MKIRRASIQDTEGMAKVHVESWKTTYQGIVADTFLNSLSIEYRKNRWDEMINNKNHFVFVAENEHGETSGFQAVDPSDQTILPIKGKCMRFIFWNPIKEKGWVER
ncbi:hypothetical protein [Alkalihalobacillus sp. AL-G]|uniref:hypothetical protein n=1 Tax=Alkalihalobacillus sp. AL-G TaxID=2926399 RepID=UPI00272CE02C|nr:hypothetical protein [Alkalihalobacillus sp. AL-G]WLD94608.1 hypothetical protein MOJ78_06905 [Alkalihalobacillus sp. AL-G]